MSRKICSVFVTVLLLMILVCTQASLAEDHKHQYRNHVCMICQKGEAGLFYEGEFRLSWKILVDRGHIVEETVNGKRTLKECSPSLQGDLIVDEGVQVIGQGCFSKSELNSILLPDSVVSLKLAAFRMSSIKEIQLNEGLREIENEAFDRMTNLKSIVLPSTLRTLGDYVFANCEALESVTFLGDDMMDKCGNYIFSGCVSLREIDLRRFNRLGEAVFQNCSSLESIDLHEGITYIPGKAFSGCTNLKSVTMTDSVEDLGRECFAFCDSLKEIRLSGGIKKLPEFGVIFNDYWKTPAIEKVYIGHGTTEIGFRAMDNARFKEIYIPLSVTFIGCQWMGNDCERMRAEGYTFEVYFEGDEFDWMLVNKHDCFENATVHCNVEY